MKALHTIPALRRLAPAIIWFEPPGRALRDPVRFLIYAMTYATARELAVLRKYVPTRDFQTALKLAPSGIMDKRSWSYWHLIFGLSPLPPMPRRFQRPQRETSRRTS